MKPSTMNQMSNSRNYYQGNAKKVLCVCSAGLLRSPTAAAILNQKFGYNTRACGTSEDFALIPLSEVLLYWADEIIVMEDYMSSFIPDLYQNKVYSLGIEDQYEYMNDTLQKLIVDRYNERVLEST